MASYSERSSAARCELNVRADSPLIGYNRLVHAEAHSGRGAAWDRRESVAFRHAGSFLVVNQPEHADLIVVLGGGNNDLRYWNGVRLMQEGYAPHLMLDVFAKGETFGNRDIDLARDFVNRTSPGTATVCALAGQLNIRRGALSGEMPAGHEC